MYTIHPMVPKNHGEAIQLFTPLHSTFEKKTSFFLSAKCKKKKKKKAVWQNVCRVESRDDN